jgi:ribose/xylose/arabinose/galactoside ABC-type transport system permease subunit
MWQNKFFSYPVPLYIGVPLMMLIGIGFGAISGLLISRIGIPPLITTLGVWQIAYGTGFLVTGGFTITRMIKPLTFFGQGFLAKGFFGGFPVAGIIWIVVGIIAYFVVHYTSYGRAVFAAGGNPTMAWLSGVNVKNIQFSVYVVSAFLATLGGLIRTARVMSLSESSFAGIELQSIATAVVGGTSLAGGKGNIFGVVLGGLIIAVILNGLTVMNADPFTESMILGLLIVVAVGVDFWRRRGR